MPSASPSDVPKYTVVVFTDIVDSTKIESDIGTTEYAKLLKWHNQIIEREVLACKGLALKHTGDGYLCLFDNVINGLLFALLANKAIHNESWNTTPIEIRCGINSGEALFITMANKDDVAGQVVVRAARVMSLANKGQILLSDNAHNDAQQYISQLYKMLNLSDTRVFQWRDHKTITLKGLEPQRIWEFAYSDSVRQSIGPKNFTRAHYITAATVLSMLFVFIAFQWRHNTNLITQNKQLAEEQAKTRDALQDLFKEHQSLLNERKNTKAVLEFVTDDVLTRFTPVYFPNPDTRKEVLSKLLAAVPSLSDTRFESDPLIKSQLLTRLAMIFSANEDHVTALRIAESAYKLSCHDLSDVSVITEAQSEASGIYASELSLSGDTDTGLKIAKSNFTLCAHTFGDESRTTIEAAIVYCFALSRTNNPRDFEESEQKYTLWIPRAEKVLGSNHPDYLSFLNNKALLFEAMNKLADAMNLYQLLMLETRRSFGESHPFSITATGNYGKILYQMKYFSSSEIYLKNCIDHCRLLFGYESPQTLRWLPIYSDVLLKFCKDKEKDKAYLDLSIELSKSVWMRSKAILPEESDDRIAALKAYADALEEGKMYEQSDPLYQQWESLVKQYKSKSNKFLDFEVDFENALRFYRRGGKGVAMSRDSLSSTTRRCSAAFGPDDPRSRKMSEEYGGLLLDLAQKSSGETRQMELSQAEEQFRDYLSWQKKQKGGDSSYETMMAYRYLGLTLGREQKYKDSGDCHEAALNIAVGHFSENLVITPLIQTWLASLEDQGKSADFVKQEYEKYVPYMRIGVSPASMLAVDSVQAFLRPIIDGLNGPKDKPDRSK
jgi:class 3 adenylate cyclase/tetratricopeptide (TPR) repeat protein